MLWVTHTHRITNCWPRYGAFIRFITNQREQIAREEAAAEAARRKLITPTGSGGGSRVPPPSALFGDIEIVDCFPDVTVQVREEAYVVVGACLQCTVQP